MIFNGVSNYVPKFQMRLKIKHAIRKLKKKFVHNRLKKIKKKICITDFVVLLPHHQFTFAETEVDACKLQSHLSTKSQVLAVKFYLF